MRFCPCGFLAVAAALLIFAEPSDGNLTAALARSTLTEQYLASHEYQDMQEKIIMAGTDTESLIAQSAIQSIRQAAQQCVADGVPAVAVNKTVEGMLTTVRLITDSGRRAYEAIEAALKLKADPIAAAEAIKNGFKVDEEIIYDVGVPSHDALGSALAIVGGAAKQGLKDSIISLQKSGTAALEILEMTGEITTLGLKAGGRAAEEALKAARESVAAGKLIVYAYLTEATKHAMDGLRNAASQASNHSGSLIPGIIESLKTNVSIDNPAALDAITKLNNGLKSVLTVSTNKQAIDAATIMHQGLVSTIMDTADAISVAKKSLEAAGKLAAQDPEAAVAAVRKGIKAAQDEILSGSAGGYLGLGAASEIAGKKAADGIIPAVIEVEYGRVAAYENLAKGANVAAIAIRTGGLAAVQGIYATLQICEAAGNALYTQFVDAGEIGFDVLRSI